MLRITAWLFSFAAALAAAVAQTSSPLQRTPVEIQAIRDSSARYVAQCLRDWDKGTHMSKEEWMSACRRLADEREDFMLEYPTAKSTPEG
jgi:hypothetical protein